MSKVNEYADLAKKLDRLLEKADGVEPHIFNESEVKDLMRLIVFIRRWDALGWWGKWMLGFFVGIGMLLVNWERILKTLKDIKDML